MADSDRCPTCDGDLIRVSVPEDIREYAPERAAVVGSCTRCLRTVALEESTDAVDGPLAGPEPPDAIPPGEGGSALLLAIGHLDSVALNRPAIQGLVEHAERAGADVFLTLDRLAADESVEPHVDLARRRRQLESMLDS